MKRTWVHTGAVILGVAGLVLLAAILVVVMLGFGFPLLLMLGTMAVTLATCFLIFGEMAWDTLVERESDPLEMKQVSLFDWLVYRHFASKRRWALLWTDRGVLRGYLGRISAAEGDAAAVVTREAVEIWNELIRQEAAEKDPDGFFFGYYDQTIPPRSWPRADRETVTALGNKKLLKLRNREDTVRSYQAHRAAQKLTRLSISSAGENDARRRWIEKYCQGDPELVLHALHIAYPDTWLERMVVLVPELPNLSDIRERFEQEHGSVEEGPNAAGELRSILLEHWDLQRQIENDAAVAQEHGAHHSDDLTEYARLKGRLLQSATGRLSRMDSDSD